MRSWLLGDKILVRSSQWTLYMFVKRSMDKFKAQLKKTYHSGVEGHGQGQEHVQEAHQLNSL